MTTSRRFVNLVLACGAILLIEEFAPVRATPPQSETYDQPNKIALRWKPTGDGESLVAVELVGLDPDIIRTLAAGRVTHDQWTSCFPVRITGQAPDPDRPAPLLWGTYRVDRNLIRFVPRFPLEPGIRYRAEVNTHNLQAIAGSVPPAGGGSGRGSLSASRLVAEYSIPKTQVKSASRVTAVYPSRVILPENLLRFYVHFSTAMSRGEAYQRIKLLDDKGKPVEAPFLELAEELWSTDGTRFTLLFDPGRIKRGLKPREEVGPVLESGRSYTLVIDRMWPDARGNPLQTEFRKSFRVGPPDESSPDPARWTVETPRASTLESLRVHFPEPLDHALLDRLITVRDVQGSVVPGLISIMSEESVWQFTPKTPWIAGDYLLEVGTDLEDLAGNSVARPFEVDATGPISGRVKAETVNLKFRIWAGDR